MSDAKANEGQRQLGRVTGAELFIEDHGILTVYVTLEFGGSVQGFGGYCLDGYDAAKKRRVGTAAGCDYLLRLLVLFGVDRLEKTVGKSVYALRDGRSGPILGLQMPEFDGGKKFLISDWRAEWYPHEVATA